MSYFIYVCDAILKLSLRLVMLYLIFLYLICVSISMSSEYFNVCPVLFNFTAIAFRVPPPHTSMAAIFYYVPIQPMPCQYGSQNVYTGFLYS